MLCKFVCVSYFYPCRSCALKLIWRFRETQKTFTSPSLPFAQMEAFTQGSNAAPMSKEVTQYVGFLDFLSSQKISVVYKILRFIKQAFSLVGIEMYGN